MHIYAVFWAGILSCVCNVEALVENQPFKSALPLTVRNANHIFNTIHSSMRQWGSSLNHNGVSFFIATVPKDVYFYHGTSQEAAVTGMEWLAFEPEHALMFARSRGPPGKGPMPTPGRPRYPPPSSFLVESTQQHIYASTQEYLSNDGRQTPSTGWLHTYRAARDLRLLYIDGMSAAKVELGTLDSQDYVLLNSSQEREGFWEYERARQLCKLANEKWFNQVQGFVRMEGGFEVILCSFEENLALVSSTHAGSNGPGPQPRGPGSDLDHFQYYKAIAARYHGIGGSRVHLDFEKFVTGYNYPVNLFSKSSMPRLQNVSRCNLATIKSDVTDMVVKERTPVTQAVNWQSIADMIVARYSTPLQYLSSPAFQHNFTLFQAELHRLLRPFIDTGNRNFDLETARCVAQVVPSTSTPTLAFNVMEFVAHTICTSLFHALLDTNLNIARKRIYSLKEYLNWTTWKECGPCALDEICVVPIWPMGTLEDWEHPTCLNASAMSGRRGYWGEPFL